MFTNVPREFLRVFVNSDRVDLELKNPEGLGLEDLARWERVDVLLFIGATNIEWYNKCQQAVKL